jgi:hypothetical protein
MSKKSSSAPLELMSATLTVIEIVIMEVWLVLVYKKKGLAVVREKGKEKDPLQPRVFSKKFNWSRVLLTWSIQLWKDLFTHVNESIVLKAANTST